MAWKVVREKCGNGGSLYAIKAPLYRQFDEAVFNLTRKNIRTLSATGMIVKKEGPMQIHDETEPELEEPKITRHNATFDAKVAAAVAAKLGAMKRDVDPRRGHGDF